jgi:hypothetical protein
MNIFGDPPPYWCLISQAQVRTHLSLLYIHKRKEYIIVFSHIDISIWFLMNILNEDENYN